MNAFSELSFITLDRPSNLTTILYEFQENYFSVNDIGYL